MAVEKTNISAAAETGKESASSPEKKNKINQALGMFVFASSSYRPIYVAFA